MRILKNHPDTKKSVLLVDDNGIMCHLMTKILEKDYNVVSFNSAIDAINWLKKSQRIPDVIVSDITMNEMNGIEFGQFLNINGLFGQIPLIFMSGNSEEDIRLQLDSVKYSAYARKPFSPDMLLKTIEKVA